MSELHDKTVAELGQLLQARKTSAVELAQHFLQRSQQHADLGAYLSIDEAATLAQATIETRNRFFPKAKIAVLSNSTMRVRSRSRWIACALRVCRSNWLVESWFSHLR